MKDKTYKVWLTPYKYKLVSVACPSVALARIGHRIWKIETSKNASKR